jgi:hypothetical protein
MVKILLNGAAAFAAPAATAPWYKAGGALRSGGGRRSDVTAAPPDRRKADDVFNEEVWLPLPNGCGGSSAKAATGDPVTSRDNKNVVLESIVDEG